MTVKSELRASVNDNPDNQEVLAVLCEAQERLRDLGYAALVDVSCNTATHRAFVLIGAELRHDVLVASVALRRGSDIVDIETGHDLAGDLADAARFYEDQT